MASWANKPASQFPTNHADFVHDVKYDFYGKRLATCSSDQSVRVWDLDDKGEWTVKSGCEWKNAHQGMIWRLAWAHPEFGQVIATCSADRTVKVWEEQEGMRLYTDEATAQNKTTWYPKAQLSDSRKQVADIDFAPRHLGLKLATGSADGNVRIYEAIDIMNLNHWPLQEVFEVGRNAGVTCLCWNRSGFDQPMIVVGTDKGDLLVWRYDDVMRVWVLAAELKGHEHGVNDVDWAPNMGRSYHLIASCGADKTLKVHQLKRVGGTIETGDKYPLTCNDTLGHVWRVEWNVTGTVLATSSDDSAVMLWKMDFKGDWVCVDSVSGQVEGEAAEDAMAMEPS
ncbi:nucleoporin-like protein [Tribonema minus]|uniref:Nucleoporin-like protein n=1 Tax=Tribonema minus TaxID=303371 RepID=A0A835Z743_9STRA|nr:nucleoporin-like protein [Tribonema minus]